MSEKKYQIDSEYLKKSVNNLCVDLISLCDDLIIEVQEEQEDKMISTQMISSLVVNIFLNFNANLILLTKKNCPKLNIFDFTEKLNNLLVEVFRNIEKEE